MQKKVIQTSNSKQTKEKESSKKGLAVINSVLTNNIELSKHKSHEIYGQYSPSNLSKNNNNNATSSNNNNQKKNNTLANTIKKIIHYSGAKKSNTQNIQGNPKSKSKKEYKNLNINDLNSQMNNNINNIPENKNDKVKKNLNNLDNILSESDSFQEIDSMEEENFSRGKKSCNMNNKRIQNMKGNIIDINNKNDENYHRHLTTGINPTKNNKNIEIIPMKQKKKNISDKNITDKFKENTGGKKKTKKLNKNNKNEDTDEEIIVNDNEFDNSRFISIDKLIETKFPKLSSNPFIGQNNKEKNEEEYKKSISSKEYKYKKINDDGKTVSTHHIKSTTLGTIIQTGTYHNSGTLSNTIELLNINLNNNPDELYRNLLVVARKGGNQEFLEILNQINALPKNLQNINFQDEKGFSALHYACDEGNLKIMEILLKDNCDVNLRNNEKKTALHLSSKRGYFDISKKLIENGAILNIYDSENNSPIHYVCMYNHVELLKFFLNKLPQVDSKNNNGKRPIDLTKNKEIKQALEEYMKKSRNSYQKIKIYETTDSQMNTMIEKQNTEDKSKEKKKINTSIQKSKNSSLSPDTKNKIEKNNKEKIKVQEHDSTQDIYTSNIKKKSTKNSDMKKSNIINKENENVINSIYARNNNGKTSPKKVGFKTNVNSSIKNSGIKKSINTKDSMVSNSQKIQKENNNKNKINIQDNNTINNNHNNTIKINHLKRKNNNYNKIINYNSRIINVLKKTRTVEQFSTVKQDNSPNKANLNNNKLKNNETLNESNFNNSNLEIININNSINNELNRINLSFKSKKVEKGKMNKSKNKEKKNDKNEQNNFEKKSKVFNNNLKYKKLVLDQIEPSANLINLNKTEENIKNNSKMTKDIFNKTKLSGSKKKNNKKPKQILPVKKTDNIYQSPKKDQQPKPQLSNHINHINVNLEKSYTSQSPTNHNYGVLSPITKKQNNFESIFNKNNIADQTLPINAHVQLNLNSIEEGHISPSSFICLAQLGKGSFGEVYLVQKISTKEKFAMKVLRKERIMGQNLLKYAIAERNVLSLSNHPFIVKLKFAFQTSTKLFLILEYCPNGDLAKHLLFEKRFSEEKAKFYICEVLLALENLHQRDIIFRDLKPDNVVLDSEGHCKLTDFGLSKEGVNDNQITNSFCGSIAYLAPEMLKKQGHGKAVDWYLLGVLLYEMLVGVTPFFTNRKEDIFHNIEFGELKIPEFVSEDAASLLRGLLQKNPMKRLGGGTKDAEEIKQHPYFRNVNWDDVYNKRIRPPPINLFTRNIMHVYQKPRLFANDDNLSISSDKNNPNMLPGWSFINNEES